jgi:hypothetical protein
VGLLKFEMNLVTDEIRNNVSVIFFVEISCQDPWIGWSGCGEHYNGLVIQSTLKYLYDIDHTTRTDIVRRDTR